MQLSIIYESFTSTLEKAATKVGLSPDILLKYVQASDPTGKVYGFILKLVMSNNIRLPEDTHKINEAIKSFEAHKRHLPVKDINRYKTIQELVAAVEQVGGITSKRSGGITVDYRSLPGVEIVGEHKDDDEHSHTYGTYVTLKVSDPGSLAEIGEGTSWCTRKSYPKCMASEYLSEYGHIFVVMNGNKPVVQYTPDYNQIMDRDDEMIGVKSPLINLVVPDTPKGAFDFIVSCYCYSESEDAENEEFVGLDDDLTRQRPELYRALLVILLQSPRWSCKFAVDLLHSRWPAAEKIISENPYFACVYVQKAIVPHWWRYSRTPHISAKRLTPEQRRWPEAEPAIMNSEFRDDYVEWVQTGQHFRPFSVGEPLKRELD